MLPYSMRDSVFVCSHRDSMHLPKYNGHVPKGGLFSSINIADNINSTLMHFEMYVYALCILHRLHSASAHFVICYFNTAFGSTQPNVLLHQSVTVCSCVHKIPVHWCHRHGCCCRFLHFAHTETGRKCEREKKPNEINIRCTFVVGPTRINLHNITA